MNVGFIRVLFMLLSAVVGHQIGVVLYGVRTQYGLYGAIIGFLISLVIILVEKMTSKASLRGMSAAVFGLIMALIIANLISAAIETVEMDPAWKGSFKLALVLILSYLGVVSSMRSKDEFNVIIPYVKFHRQDEPDTPIVLDTSAIIDGRIADISHTHFLEGHFVIPKFVLKELQTLSDSTDSIKRSRGRRGLEILNRLKKNTKFHYRIHSDDIPGTDEVDQKLINLCRLLDAKIVTTDFNLNKVADFHGITVLNVNDLANAVKPVLLPGERLEVQPIKVGKEREQAVAYLNDGTMVVVEDAKPFIGQSVVANVTSVLQTPAGRMIFSKMEKTSGSD